MVSSTPMTLAISCKPTTLESSQGCSFQHVTFNQFFSYHLPTSWELGVLFLSGRDHHPHQKSSCTPCHPSPLSQTLLIPVPHNIQTCCHRPCPSLSDIQPVILQAYPCLPLCSTLPLEWFISKETLMCHSHAGSPAVACHDLLVKRELQYSTKVLSSSSACACFCCLISDCIPKCILDSAALNHWQVALPCCHPSVF